MVTLAEQTKFQLVVLKEICTITGMLEMDFWLRGGWAIDFLLGEVTRLHDDIDIVTWIENREQMEKELLEAGYEQIPVQESFRNRQSDFRKGKVEVTCSYITKSNDGNLIMNGLPEWVWLQDALLPESFMLQGVSAKVLNPKQLLEEKDVYEQIGRTPRQKDIESKKILRHIIEELEIT